MSCAYKPKDSQVNARALLVQELAIPFFITHNATAASVGISCDEPSLLFFNTAGVSQITVANGAVDSSAELAGITYASPVDATGLCNVLLRINEPAVKLVSMQVVSRNNQSQGVGYLPSAPSNGITSVGNKFAFNLATGGNFSTTDFDGCLVVRYVAGE